MAQRNPVYHLDVMEIVGELAELTGEEFRRRLDDVQRTRPHLHADVVALLQQRETAHGSQQASWTDGDNDGAKSGSAGTLASPIESEFGHFRIIRKLGAGGMGEVFEAQQERPKRRVALKVIHAHCLQPSTLRRFEYEAEILGRLEHPGIVRIYEAGSVDTPLGPRPFLAMELIHATRLDQWISDQHPDLTRKLNLLRAIAETIQHAHEHGVIHRDLKPSNILVTESDQPKVLDFGIARMVEGDVTAHSAIETLHTRSGQILGTLQYMSPEQAAGGARNLDTRSDIYALGVIAYQVLTGRLPYNLEGKYLPDAVRVICEAEPTRLRSINRQLPSELETIVFKALSKERDRRYASAAELADDLKRFLGHEPIAARKPNLPYLMAKFLRRHRWLVAWACVGITLLTAGIIGLWRASAARRAELEQRGIAAALATTTDEVRAMLQEVILTADPNQHQGEPISPRAWLDRAVQGMEDRFHDQPLVKAGLLNALANSYAGIGCTREAVEQFRRAAQLYHASTPLTHLDRLLNDDALAEVLADLGQRDEAEQIRHQVLTSLREVLGDEDERTLRCASRYGRLLRDMGRLADAQSILVDTLAKQRRTLPALHAEIAESANNLGLTLVSLGNYTEAESYYREAVESVAQSMPRDRVREMQYKNNLASCLHYLQHLEEALSTYHSVRDLCHQVLGEDHPRTLIVASNMAGVLSDLGKLEESDQLYQKTLATCEDTLGKDHPQTLFLRMNLAANLIEMKQTAEAITHLQAAASGLEKVLGESNPQTLNANINLSRAYLDQGSYQDTIRVADQFLPVIAQSMGAGHPFYIAELHMRAKALEQSGHMDQARLAYEEVLQLCDDPQRTISAETAEKYRRKCQEFLGNHPSAEATDAPAAIDES